MKIEGRTFIVTGASSGLGAATARKLISDGGLVVLADLNEEAGQKFAQELGDKARFVAADISDEASVQHLVRQTLDAFDALHGVVNCAGIAPAHKVLGRQGVHSFSAFSRVLNVNLLGTFNVIRLAAEAMQRNEPTPDGERGAIVNTASVAAFEGQIGQSAYAASKGGIVAMTLPIARELSAIGIRVNTIAPGIMETPMLLSMPPEVQESLGKMVPFPSRLGKPEEFADLAKFLIENPYMNGETVRIDGAIRMGAR